jgi:hypothetical protein
MDWICRLPLRRAAMIRMLPGTSGLIVMRVAEDILKIEFAEVAED